MSASINKIGLIAAGYSDAMNIHAQNLQDPSLTDDPAKLAIFMMEMDKLTSAYQLTARTAQTLHREDQILSELLRDA